MFIIIELQTSHGTTTNLVYVFSDRNSAEHQYHTILSSAAVSTVDVHTAILTNEYGAFLKKESYNHNA